MPAGSEWKRRWWAYKSGLEKLLIGVLALAILIIIILLILLITKGSKASPETCSSKACLIEAAKIAQYVDADVNPCENFYEFACGNFLKNAHGDEKLQMLNMLKEQSKRELMEAYSEPIKEQEHRMVKTVKKLFGACMDTKGIQTENLRTIKEDLKLLGGWPVVESTNWNGTSFNWLNATYKLRELGYYYKIFLELSIEPDPANDTQFIYKVATPYMWDYSSYNFDKTKFMTDVAIRFGAPQYEQAVDESMKSAVQFLTQLQMETHSRYSMSVHSKYTVEQYQNLYGAIDWLEFINKLAGPGAGISKTDFVLFPPPETLRSWINIISRTPKRVQANYMFWKVIEETIPFLTLDLQNPNLRATKDETRAEFCMREIQERFTPSPAEIITDRKYLPMEKKQKVEELVQSIKSQHIKALENADWIEENDRKQIVEKVKANKVVIAHPDNYFEDKILDDLAVDMMDIKRDSFLSLMAQANRNHQTMLYNQIRKPENVYNKLYVKTANGLPVYNTKDNVFFVPRTATQDLLFNENRPQYLNYGLMGVAVGQHVNEILIEHIGKYHRASNAEIWSNKTMQEVTNKLKCLKETVPSYVVEMSDGEVSTIMQSIAGEKLSYLAYEEWVKMHGEELPLIKIDYTPKQAFWISLMSTFCQPVHEYSFAGRRFPDYQLFGKMVSASVRNHPQLAKDFQCPAGSEMNPSSRCQMF